MTTLAELLEKANASTHPRAPGQWTPAACTAWNEAQGETRDLIYAALVWELDAGRLAQPKDEPAIRERMAKIRDATAAANADGEAA